MSERYTALWRDPLFNPGDRFPLGPPCGIMDNCCEEPSGPATRPFSLRHVVPGARLDTPISPAPASVSHTPTWAKAN